MQREPSRANKRFGVLPAPLSAALRLTVLLSLLGPQLGCLGPPAFVPDAEHGFLERKELTAHGTYRYFIYRPKHFDPTQKLPIILYLHGGGERGDDGVAPTQVGIGQAVQKTLGYLPFLVVFPQCDRRTYWALPEMAARAMAAVETAIRDFNGDPDRIYVTGNSMGGFGTYYLAARYPGRFAALAPICGGVRPPRWVPVPKEARLIGRRPLCRNGAEARPYSGVDFPWRRGSSYPGQRIAKNGSGTAPCWRFGPLYGMAGGRPQRRAANL